MGNFADSSYRSPADASPVRAGGGDAENSNKLHFSAQQSNVRSSKQALLAVAEFYCLLFAFFSLITVQTKKVQQ